MEIEFEQKRQVWTEILKCLSYNNYYALLVSSNTNDIDGLYTEISKFLFEDKAGFVDTLPLQNVKYEYSKGRFWFKFVKTSATLEGRLLSAHTKDAVTKKYENGNVLIF